MLEVVENERPAEVKYADDVVENARPLAAKNDADDVEKKLFCDL